MQIFLTSHTHSSSRISSHKHEENIRGFAQSSLAAGFTLIELLISVAIIGIITMIVLIKYSSFDSTTLLKGAAYEMALALREAQVKSVSVVRSSTDSDNDATYGKFDYPFGVSFTPGLKTYKIFQFTDIASLGEGDHPFYGSIDEDFPAVDIGQTTLERSLEISDICFMESSTWYCHGDDPGITRLDISFRRPEFTALFHVEGYAGDEADITRVQIKVSSDSDATFVVEVSRLGQITVSPE